MAHLAELSSLDATALADLVRARSISPLELVEATIARSEQINPSLTAIVAPLDDQARAAAAQPVSDSFGGVPFLLKDLLAGSPARGRLLGSHVARLIGAAAGNECSGTPSVNAPSVTGAL